MSAALSHFQHTTPDGGIWHSLNRLLIALILIALLIGVGYRFVPEFSKRRVQLAILQEIKLEVEKERQLLARNERLETMLRRDAEYLGIIARDRLDLAKEGETIYRFEPGPAKMRRNK